MFILSTSVKFPTHAYLRNAPNNSVQVCADKLGTRAIPLHALLGRVHARQICPNPKLAAALSLVTDVHHLNGGRQVTLRSVFRIQVREQVVFCVS